MGFALKLNSVDFSDVAVDQVTFIEQVPCTALALDKDTLTFTTAEETKTLTATKTPSDTTDTLTWSSSNNNIASVENGVVTIHGIGTATITARCGNQIATATISQTTLKTQYESKVLTDVIPGPVNASEADKKLISVDSGYSGQATIGQAYHADNVDLRVLNGLIQDVECIRVPYGASKVKFTSLNGQSQSISYTCVVDTTNFVTFSGSNYPEYLRQQTFVNSVSGYAVEYGEAVIFRPTSEQLANVGYIYFE